MGILAAFFAHHMKSSVIKKGFVLCGLNIEEPLVLKRSVAPPQ